MNSLETTPLVRIPRGDGEHFDIAGAKLTWKVKSDVTQGRFCFFEQVLQPGDAVPLHVHGYTETFYILAGTVTFLDATNKGSRVRSSTGDVVVVQPGAFHGFGNESDEEARLLSISVPEHQRFFDAVASADRDLPFATMTPEMAMQRVAAIGDEYDSVFARPDAG
ncbi:cupin domain-containing protein [Sphingomonas sp. DT-51]|uniref:cupin domain-containing protein n=1 Tax=Sphingomonas sp. DT-51 TaxID=3396165 RepID=UPI003F1B9CE5